MDDFVVACSLIFSEGFMRYTLLEWVDFVL